MAIALWAGPNTAKVFTYLNCTKYVPFHPNTAHMQLITFWYISCRVVCSSASDYILVHFVYTVCNSAIDYTMVNYSIFEFHVILLNKSFLTCHRFYSVIIILNNNFKFI